MSRVKAAFWGSISSQLFMVLSLVVSIGTTPIILRYLNKQEYGLSTILFQIVSYLSIFDFGLAGAISRHLTLYRQDDLGAKDEINKIVSTGFFSFLCLGVLVFSMGLFISPLVPKIFEMKAELKDVAQAITFTLSIFIAIQFPMRTFSGIFYAHQKQLLSNTVNFSVGLLNLVLPVFFLYIGYGLWSFVYTYLLSICVSIILNFFLLRRYYPFIKIRTSYFDLRLLKNLFGFGFFLFLNSVAVQIVFYTDKFMIGSIVSLAFVSIYAVTARISDMSRDLIFKITDNALPAIIEINSKEGDQKFRVVHHKLLTVTVTLSMIAFSMILIFNYYFIKLWVGDSFYGGNLIVLLSLILMLQHTILHVGAAVLNGAGVVKGFSLISIAEALLNLVFTIYFGRIYGVVGILLATILAGVLTSVWFVPFALMKNIKITLKQFLIRPVIAPILVILPFGTALYILIQSVFRNIPLNWISLILVAILTSALLVIYSWYTLLQKEFSGYIPPALKAQFPSFLFARNSNI